MVSRIVNAFYKTLELLRGFFIAKCLLHGNPISMIYDSREESIHRMFRPIICEGGISDNKSPERIFEDDNIWESDIFEGIHILLESTRHKFCHETISCKSEFEKGIFLFFPFSFYEGCEDSFESEYIEASPCFFVHTIICFDNLRELSSEFLIFEVWFLEELHRRKVFSSLDIAIFFMWFDRCIEEVWTHIGWEDFPVFLPDRRISHKRTDNPIGDLCNLPGFLIEINMMASARTYVSSECFHRRRYRDIIPCFEFPRKSCWVLSIHPYTLSNLIRFYETLFSSAFFRDAYRVCECVYYRRSILLFPYKKYRYRSRAWRVWWKTQESDCWYSHEE